MHHVIDPAVETSSATGLGPAAKNKRQGQTAVMSDGFTKVTISLVLRVVHICLIHPLKAQIFVYPMIYGRNYPDLLLRKKFKTYFFTFIFLSKISRLIWH